MLTQIKNAFLSLLVVLTPLLPFMYLTGVVIMADTFLGAKVAKKNGNFKSRSFAAVLYKMLAYNILLIITYQIDIWLVGDVVSIWSSIELSFTKAIVAIMLINEVISIDEKLLNLNGKGLRYYFKRALNVVKAANDERKNFFNGNNLILIGVLLTGLYSCKSAEHHYKKFVQKGGEVKTITIRDSIPYAIKGEKGKDSLIYITVEKDCPSVEFPKSKTEIKQQGKTDRTEIKEKGKTDRTEIKTSGKVEETEIKQKGKTDRTESDNDRKKAKKKPIVIWLLFAYCLGVFSPKIFKIVRKLIIKL